jgi:hypothetical protein
LKIGGQTKDELLKKFALEKKRNHKSLCFQDLKLDVSLAIKISKHQYYYQFKTQNKLSPSLSVFILG